MKKHFSKRLLALVLAVVMCLGLALPASAAESGNDSSIVVEKVDNSLVSASIPGRETAEIPEDVEPYKDSEMVRVSIILEKAGTIEAGYSPEDIADNASAMNYRETVKREQMSVTNRIENAIGEDLDVVWNLTLATNIISANVEYGQIEAIEGLKGVKGVVIETRYETDLASVGGVDPNMSTSGKQIGSNAAWAAGYTGAGSRIAIIDTGIDPEHEAFDAGAFEYSLGDKISELDLLDAAEIADLVDELNIGINADNAYYNSKIPFGVNYVDLNYNITHLYDQQGEHGSHVAGIAAANKYVADGEGYTAALESSFVQGVAPDAQLIIMKVFGESGGAYDSDYMVAIEDAIILGADSINLSLGSGNPGMSRNSTAEYQEILDSLVKSGVVVAMSAGNSGSWVEMSENGVPYLYADDVSMQTDGSPGSFTNSLAVASVDNDGFTALYVKVDDNIVSYAESNEYGNAPLTTIGGEQEFVFINGIGTPEQFAQVDVSGKIAICYRGETSFFEKANAAVAAGAKGVFIVNNQDGIIYLNLTGYEYTAPVVSITQADGELFKLGEAQITEGGLEYWTGTVEVSTSVATGQYNSDYYTMSSFSSWGVPGSLQLKPEIVAPGGSIYSVNGANAANGVYSHNAYELMSGTSMASPQVAGMAAVVAQYIRENDLCAKTGLDARTLAQSLLMSTAVPMYDAYGNYYSLMQQGAGLANVGAAVSADSYILMGADATSSYADGKVKAELGDDSDRSGVYSFSFTINNLEDEAKDFVLSADAFIQTPTTDGRSYFMYTSTTGIAPSFSWTSSGKLSTAGDMGYVDYYDINGDGLVNEADGQMILDYTTGLVEEISELADIDGDEDIDTYDAYLFFTLNLDAETIASVPANSSVTIQVTMNIGAWGSTLDYYYPNGTYIQGYVYAESVSTDEGVEGTSHSIPVLGFYGNWSDASMYDKGSYVEYAYGLENRPPYLYSSAYRQGNYNSLLIKYHDDSSLYHFGGNPMVSDDQYMPERNAINNENGDVISKIGFTSIRNAATSAFIVKNHDSGVYYAIDELGSIYSAYYYVNGSAWKNTYYTVNTNFSPAGLAEGTTLDVGLVLIPEYYTLGGSIDLSKLGEGAYFTMPMTVDNTAPVIAENGVSIDEESKTLTVSVSDNEYVAAVALYDIYGQYLYSYTGSKSDAVAGEAYDFVLSLEDVDGSSFLLQVYDYACNTSTYKISQQIGEITEEIDSIKISKDSIVMQKGNVDVLSAIVYPVNAVNREVVWSSSDETVVSVDENGVITAVAAGSATVTATSAADSSKSASCDVIVIDINVDLNGIVWDEEGAIWFSEFNTTGLPEYTELSSDMLEQDYFVSATVGPDGTLYASTLNTSNGTGSLYTINTETWEATLLAPCSVQGISIFYSDLTYVPAMFGTGALLGSYGPYVIAIDPSTGTSLGIIDSYEDLGGEIVGITTCYGMYDPDYGEYQDVVYVVLNNGIVAQEIYYGYDGLVVPMMYYFYGFRAAFDCGVDVGDSWYFNSAYYDGSYLYWSAFDENANDNDVELFAIDADYTGNTYSLGTFAEGIWPVGGLHQGSYNVSTSEESALTEEEEQQLRAMIEEKGVPQYVIEKKEISAKNSVSGSLNSTVESSYESADLDVAETIVLDITAMGAEGVEVEVSTNGLVTVTYDPEEMTLVKVEVNGDYTAKVVEEGKVTFAYVSLEGISDLAQLTFTTNESRVDLTVTHEEVINAKPAYEEVLSIKAKPNPILNVVPGEPDEPDVPDEPDQPDEPDVPTMNFEDVTEKDWFYNDVKYVFENGLMQGVSDTLFNPYGDMSRAMVVTVLYRMEGEPEVSGTNSFTDLTQDWYKDAVQWAVENGITKGVSDTQFAPTTKVTREQLVTFLYRYAVYKGIDVSSGENVDLSVFKDADQISAYAVDAVKWAVAEGIIKGSDIGLEPAAGATRAQAAAILHRFLAE